MSRHPNDEEVTAGSVMKLALDKIRIGKAMLNNDQVMESIMKSTSHKNVPPKEKHVRRLISATGTRPLPALSEIVEQLGKRVTKSNDWKVVLKALQVFHRMIQEAHPSFTKSLIAVGVGKVLSAQMFRDRSTNVAIAQQEFIRQYARYVEERTIFYRVTNIRQLSPTLTIDQMMDLLDQNPKRKQKRDSFEGGYDGDSNDSGDGDDEGSSTSNRRFKASSLFFLMESMQNLMEELLRTHEYMRLSTVQQIATASAFSLLIQDSRSIYKMQTMAIMALLDIYFTLPPKDARVGFELTRANKKQTQKLLEWYEFAASSRVVKQSLVPQLKPQPEELLESMKSYMEKGEIPSSRSYDDDRSKSPDSNIPTSNLQDILSHAEIEQMNADDSYQSAPATQGGDDLLFLSEEPGSRSTEQTVDELFGATPKNNSDPFGQVPLQQPISQNQTYANGPFVPMMSPYGYPTPPMMAGYPGAFSPGMGRGFHAPHQARPAMNNSPSVDGGRTSITGRTPITSSNKIQSPAKSKKAIIEDPFSSLLNENSDPWM